MSFLMKLASIFWVSLCLVLTACGGGGGGGGGGDTTPPSNDGGDTGSDDSSGDDSDDNSVDDDTTDDDSTDDDHSNDDGHDHDDLEVVEDEDREPDVGEVREESPALTMESSPQQITLSWETYGNDDHYHLWEYENGDVRQEIAVFSGTNSRTIDVVTHRHPWNNINYILAACIADNDCYESEVTPVTDEIMLSTIGYLKPFEQVETEGFGGSVAVSEDGATLAVGATDSSSGVYLFTRGEEGWTQSGVVTSEGEEADEFGASLALSSDGQTLAVGAPGAAATGAVYVFTRGDDTWTQAQQITASNAEEGDAFGHSLALSGDGLRLAVGAPGEASSATGVDGDTADNSADGAGAVYVFNQADDNWTQTAYVKASNAEADDAFGTSLALNADGSVLVVGAPGEDSAAGEQADNSASNAGATYVFSGANGWQQQAYVKASDGVADNHFGQAVALNNDGSRMVVGTAGERSSEEGVTGSNAAYIFANTEGSWSELTALTPTDPQSAGEFGASVAINGDGDYVVVGAPATDSDAVGIANTAVGGAPAAGAVFSFAEDDEGWAQEAFIKASNTDADDRFGTSVALGSNGDALAVGAVGEDSNATGVSGEQDNDEAADRGAVYVY